jgi:hypothetical protein
MSKKKRIAHKAGAATFYLKPIPRSLLRVALAEHGKPQPPTREVKFAGGGTQMRPDESDPAYQSALGLWYATYSDRLVKLCLTHGVEEVDCREPTAEELETLKLVFQPKSDGELRLLWLIEVLGDTVDGFMNLCLGQSVPTAQELGQAEEFFRSDDQEPDLYGETEQLSGNE